MPRHVPPDIAASPRIAASLHRAEAPQGQVALCEAQIKGEPGFSFSLPGQHRLYMRLPLRAPDE